MTVAELLARIDHEEWRHWQAYYKLVADDIRDHMSEHEAIRLANRNR